MVGNIEARVALSTAARGTKISYLSKSKEA